MIETKPMTTSDLLSYCYANREEYIRSFDSINEGVRLYDCLVDLVEDGTVSSMEELADYGMEL